MVQHNALFFFQDAEKCFLSRRSLKKLSFENSYDSIKNRNDSARCFEGCCLPSIKACNASFVTSDLVKCR